MVGSDSILCQESDAGLTTEGLALGGQQIRIPDWIGLEHVADLPRLGLTPLSVLLAETSYTMGLDPLQHMAAKVLSIYVPVRFEIRTGGYEDSGQYSRMTLLEGRQVLHPSSQCVPQKILLHVFLHLLERYGGKIRMGRRLIAVWFRGIADVVRWILGGWSERHWGFGRRAIIARTDLRPGFVRMRRRVDTNKACCGHEGCDGSGGGGGVARCLGLGLGREHAQAYRSRHGRHCGRSSVAPEGGGGEHGECAIVVYLFISKCGRRRIDKIFACGQYRRMSCILPLIFLCDNRYILCGMACQSVLVSSPLSSQGPARNVKLLWMMQCKIAYGCKLICRWYRRARETRTGKGHRKFSTRRRHARTQSQRPTHCISYTMVGRRPCW